MFGYRRGSRFSFRFSRLLKVAAVLGVGALSLGMVACHRGTPEARIDWIASRIASKYDFNQDQRARLDALKAQLRGVIGEFKKVREDTRATLKEEIGKNSMDAQRLTASLQANLDVVSRNLPRIVESIVEIHATLNEEQKKEVREHVNEHLDRFADRDDAK